jgi:hypothetical protein
MPFDLLSNPKLTENNLAQLGSTAFECLQAELIRATSKNLRTSYAPSTALAL